MRIPFKDVDAWFEEDQEIYVHPKDPYKRVDIIPSSREVRVHIGGKMVAESKGGMWLFETGLPVRYYLEKTAVSRACELGGRMMKTRRERASSISGMLSVYVLI